MNSLGCSPALTNPALHEADCALTPQRRQSALALALHTAFQREGRGWEPPGRGTRLLGCLMPAVAVLKLRRKKKCKTFKRL